MGFSEEISNSESVKKMFEDVNIEIVVQFLLERISNDRETYYKAINENVCPHCKRVAELKLRHQNCSYAEKYRNYYLLCDLCQDEIWNLYQDRWDDLYSAYK